MLYHWNKSLPPCPQSINGDSEQRAGNVARLMNTSLDSHVREEECVAYCLFPLPTNMGLKLKLVLNHEP